LKMTNPSNKLSEDQLLNEIQRLARRLGKVPSIDDMDRDGRHSHMPYYREFESWAAAVEKAGFTPHQPIPQEFMIEKPDHCRLCEDDSHDEYGFHHWRYGDEPTGCYLCHECHDLIHDKGRYPNHSDGWLLETIDALANEHEQLHGDVTDEELTERYNVQSAAVVRAARED
jgi:hypothetical protein